ncbi:MAG: hypothetical protein Fur0016_04150 [Anaerolineales bacterium]
MNDFPPPRQRGLVIHIVLITLLVITAGVAFWQVFQTPVGVTFAIYIVVFLVSAIPLPVLAYRLYALMRSNYQLDRNTLLLMWGMRVEEIPISEIEWLRPVHGLIAPLALPLFRLPGSILGLTRQPDIGEVEFMASEASSLLLVATPRRVFAISPENPAAFAAAFQKIIEMGSLTPGKGRSEFPSFVIGRAWESAWVRSLWLAGLLLNIGSLVWVSALIPTTQRVTLGFGPGGAPLDAVPAAQLILLPLLSIVLFAIGWLAGVFFYRRTDQQILSLTLWASSTLTSLLFLIAIYFILTTPI